MHDVEFMRLCPDDKSEPEFVRPDAAPPAGEAELDVTATSSPTDRPIDSPAQSGRGDSGRAKGTASFGTGDPAFCEERSSITKAAGKWMWPNGKRATLSSVWKLF